MTQRMLALLDPEALAEARELLGYPEESIDRLMTPDYVAVQPDWTVREALAHIRATGKDSETLNVIYVVDEEGHLLEDLLTRQLLLADPETPIRELMDEHGADDDRQQHEEREVGTKKAPPSGF